jgi:membrane dipeptidase
MAAKNRWLVFDGDYPMAQGAIDLNRDLTAPLAELRSSPQTHDSPTRVDAETLATVPEMRRGGVAAALVKLVGRIHRDTDRNPTGFRTGDIAYAYAQCHLAYYRILEKRGFARILRSPADLKEHFDIWERADGYDDLPVGFVIGMEGADSILWPELVHEWWDDGVRVISLSHYGLSTYCHGTGTGTDGGLFPPAGDLLREMDKAGMILDLTHAADESVRQALELFSGRIVASHQNCRAIAPGERQFPDDQLLAIIERDGVIGHSMDTWMLYPGGWEDWGDMPTRPEVFAEEDITLEQLADHIDHVCQLAGNSRHAAIGGDTDGQGGCRGTPYEVDSVADYQKLAPVLEKRGYSDADIDNVLYKNWQRFFESYLP